MQASPSIVIRPAAEHDEHTLARLATLDSRSELTGPALLAEVDGVAVAHCALPVGGVGALSTTTPINSNDCYLGR